MSEFSSRMWFEYSGSAEVEVDAYKVAEIVAEPSYSPVSAWEFDFLQEEEVFRERLSSSTIYIIGQRPMLWFDNVRIADGEITLEISDGQSPGVPCRIVPAWLGIGASGEMLDIEVSFHRDARSDTPPYRNVAAIRVYDKEGRFLVWWSPQKLIYECLTRGLKVEIGQGIERFLDFKVHYIGKAFSQRVWDRLNKHRKYTKILVREGVQGAGHAQPSLEITLFMLRVTGLDEEGYLLGADQTGEDEPPVLHRVRPADDDPRYGEFRRQWATPGDAAVTTELEALLINLFQPQYNETRFKEYPAIANGLRSLGYADTELTLENFPFRLLAGNGTEPLAGDGGQPDRD